MNRPMLACNLTTRRATCRGFALPTLMVMLSLASLATLLALRNLWVNEQLLNSEADQLRTQHKAEAALPVAVADIGGTPLQRDDPSLPKLRHTAGDASHTHAFFPASLLEYDLLRQRLTAFASPCSAGICAPNTLDAKTNQASYWKTQIATAMTVSASDMPEGDATAWYWVEVFPQPSTSTTNAASAAPFIYRITTLAKGVMPGSTAVLQAIWVRNATTTGQWHSWHVLHD